MNSTDFESESQRAVDLQDGFFQLPNQCNPLNVSTSEQARNTLLLSLKRHASGAIDRGVILPFRTSVLGPTAWYFCACSTQMLRALQDEIRAFIGPSYAEECPQDRARDAADKHALPLIQKAGWFAFRMDSRGPNDDVKILNQWHLYEDLLNRRPASQSYVPRTFHQLRASFDRALLARDEAAAKSSIAALRERFGVSAENRLFLEVRLKAAFERWDDIAQHVHLQRLVQLQLPPETYGDVMEALYRSRVQAFECGPELEPLLLRFKDEIAVPVQRLFKTRGASRRPTVLKAFLLYELTQDNPQWTACERIIEELPLGAFGAVDALVRERCTQTLAPVDIEVAKAALESEQFDRAWDLYWDLPDGVDVLRALIACARESTDPVKVANVLARLDAAEPEIRAIVESTSATRIKNLRAGLRPPIGVDNHVAPFIRWPGEPEDHYVARWAEFVRSVDPATITAQKGLAEATVDCLVNFAVEDAVLFERLYPLWHELFIDRVKPSPQLVPVYLEMLEALRARDVFQRTEQELVHQVLLSIVEGGDSDSYRLAVETVSKIFEDIRSPQALGWALDVCDSLSQRRVRDANARLSFLVRVIQACQEFSARLDALQICQLRLLAKEARLDPPAVPLNASVVDDAKGDFDNSFHRIAIYSLDDGPTRRAAEILKSLHPNWIVDTNADEVCTDRLKAMARNADVFVFAWRCSKHAAFFCVKASAQKEKIVFARGVGTTSLVVAAVEFLKASST